MKVENKAVLIDFGSTYTKVTAVDIEACKILGTAQSFTTISTDLTEGLNHALESLENKVPNVSQFPRLACSSAAGGLKIIAIGLVPELTAEAAKRAALSAGAKVIKVYAYELTPNDLEEIQTLAPDMVLLTGGTDGGNQKIVLKNAESLAAINRPFPIVYAGNKSIAHLVTAILAKSGEAPLICSNVMPVMNQIQIDDVRETIRRLFLERIVEAKGLSKVQTLMDNIIMPTPLAVMNSAALLANGTSEVNGIGDLVLIDIGGATTDIHSICSGLPTGQNVTLKGLQEPYVKRTVEGDLGLRYSSNSLAQQAGMTYLTTETGLSVERIQEILDEIQKWPERVFEDEERCLVEAALTQYGVGEAFRRHVGYLEEVYTPFGKVTQQSGKDLRQVKWVIGTGGPLIHKPNAQALLKGVVWQEEAPMLLKPIHPSFMIDRDYIVAAMGLLAEINKNAALTILKQYF